jgi:hypothetical protein
MFGVVKAWTSEKDEIELDGYRYVCKLRKKNGQIGRFSGSGVTFYKEKLYHWVQMLNNIGINAMWVILKADNGKDRYRCMLQSSERIDV